MTILLTKLKFTLITVRLQFYALSTPDDSFHLFSAPAHSQILSAIIISLSHHHKRENDHTHNAEDTKPTTNPGRQTNKPNFVITRTPRMMSPQLPTVG